MPETPLNHIYCPEHVPAVPIPDDQMNHYDWKSRLRLGWECRLVRWTTPPVLGMRPPRWSLLSPWIMMITSRSCCTRHWTPLPASVTGPSRSWCWTVMLWWQGEWCCSDLCLGEARSLELEWSSLRRSSSLERWRWLSVPVSVPDVPLDLDGRTTLDCTPLEQLSLVADLLDFDLWVDSSDLRLFFSFGPNKAASGAWISMLLSMDSCSFLAAEAPFHSTSATATLPPHERPSFLAAMFCTRCMASLWCTCVLLHWSGTVDIAHGYRLVSESENT